MAITVTETWASDLGSKVDQRGKIRQTAKREFDAISDDPANDHEGTVKDASGVPVENAIHPRLGDAFRCKNIRIVRKTPVLYRAIANYETPQFDSGGDTYPWNQAATVDYYTITTEGEIDQDASGDPLITAAEERIEGITRPFSDQGIRIKKNFLSYTASAFYTYMDTVNSDLFLTFPAGTCKVVDISATDKIYQEQTYYEVTVSVAARKPYNTTNAKAWYKRIRHEGYYAREDVGGKIIEAVNLDTKLPAKRPQLLDADGVQLAKATPPTYPAAVWLEKEVFESVAFQGMGLF